MTKSIIIILFFLVRICIQAQSQKDEIHAVHTVDGIAAEVLALLSFEAGETRDWEKFRQLFLPDANFTV